MGFCRLVSGLRLLQQTPRLVAIRLARQHWRLDLDARSLTRRTACVDVHQRARDCDAARIKLDEATAGLEGQFDSRFDNHFLAGLEVYFAAGFGQLSSAELDVLALADGEMVVGFDFYLAVAADGQVFFGAEFAVAVGLDGVVAFVADANLLVVLDVLVPVPLGVEVDLLSALAVLEA